MEFARLFVNNAVRWCEPTCEDLDDRVEVLMEKNYKLLFEKKNQEILAMVFKLMRKHILGSSFAAISERERARLLDVADKKKVMFVRWTAYMTILARTPLYQLEMAPKMGLAIEGAVHNDAAPIRIPCPICDKTYNDTMFCKDCDKTLKVLKKTVAFGSLFKSEVSAMRYYFNTCKGDILIWREKMETKRAYKTVVRPPVVSPQEVKDFDMNWFRDVRPRGRARMDRFNDKKQAEYVDRMLDSARVVADDIQKKMEERVTPQNFDIEKIWDSIKAIAMDLYDRGYVTVAILAIVGAALAALVIWIWTSDKATLLLQILATLVGTLTIVGLLGPLIGRVVRILQAREERKLEEKVELQKEKNQKTGEAQELLADMQAKLPPIQLPKVGSDVTMYENMLTMDVLSFKRKFEEGLIGRTTAVAACDTKLRVLVTMWNRSHNTQRKVAASFDGKLFDLNDFSGAWDVLTTQDSPNIEVRPQADDGSLGEAIEVMLKGTTEAMAKDSNVGLPWVKSTLGYVHSTATMLRDVKSIAEIVQPFVECAVGSYYELVTDSVWIPWSQRGFMDELLPVLKEHAEYLEDPHRASKLFANMTYQGKVKAHAEIVTKLEEKLTRMRVPPRYLAQLVHARQECAQWVAELVAASLVGHDRVEPVGVMILGVPGSGKSTAMTQLFHDVHATVCALHPEIDKDFNDGMVYPKKVNTEKDFDDGYKGQPYTSCDDFLQSDDVALRRAEVLWTVGAVNRAPMKLNMAALPDKAGTFFRSVIVGITRNGRAKPTNLGIIDYKAFARRFPLIYQATDVKGVFNRLSIGGVVVQTGVTREIMAQQVAGLVLEHHKRTLTKVEAVPLGISLEDLEAVGQRLSEAHQSDVANVRFEKETAQKQGKKKWNKPQYVKPQGNTLGGSSVDQIEDEMIELKNMVEAIDVSPVLSDSFYDKLEARLDRLGVKLTKIEEAHEKACEGVQTLMQKYLEHLQGLKKWSVRTWDRVSNWVGSLSDSMTAKFWGSVVTAGLKGAMTALVEWITTTVAGKVVAAISAAVLVAAVVAGVIATVKHLAFAEPSVELQSRTEKEIARERQAAKDIAQEQEVKFVNGKMHRMGTVPKGMDPTYVTGQLLENEIPLIEALSKNLYTVLSETKDGRVITGNVVMLAGRFGVTVRHVAEEFIVGGNILLTQVYTKGEESNTIHRKVPTPEVWYREGSELAFVYLDASWSPSIDITGHFITDADAAMLYKYGVERPKVIYRLAKGVRQIAECEPNVRAEFIPGGAIKGFKTTESDTFIRFPAETPDGASGGLVVSTSMFATRHALGIHGGNAPKTTYDLLVTREMIAEAAKHDGAAVVIPQLAFVTNVALAPKNQVTPMGVLKFGHSSTGKNRITLSPLAEFLVDHPDPSMRLKTVSLPTVMYKTTVGETYAKWKARGLDLGEEPENPEKIADPYANAYDVDPPFFHISDEALEEIYTPDLCPKIPNNKYFLISPEDAVFGNVGLGIKPIELFPSAGYNWLDKKDFTRYTLFGMDKNAPKRTTFDRWDPDLRQAILDNLRALAKGQFPLGLVCDSLKAENRSIARVLLGQTRLYYAGFLATLIVSRCFRAYLTTVEKATPTLSIPAVGITPTSAEWGELYHRLREQPNLITTDAYQYDKFGQYMIQLKIGEWHGNAIASGRLDHSGLNPAWREANGSDFEKKNLAHCFKAIYAGSCDAIHIAGSVAYRDSQTMNSGVDRTSQDNSYRGEISSRLAFTYLWKKNRCVLQDRWKQSIPIYVYLDCVRRAFYGDDMAVSVSDDISDWFHTESYVMAIKATTGTVLTMPDKTVVPAGFRFISWEDAELLKRGFVSRGGRIYAPLQKKVIEDSLFWCGRANRRNAIASDTVRSVLLEAAIHGPEYFARMFAICERACNLARVKFDPLSYEAVMRMHTH